jgi:hypothetical protein
MSDYRTKRELGEGRWDKILKKRMVSLSEADNYDDAKEEWIATGRVWWGHYANDAAPDWVNNSSNGRGKCLCGHTVVYHFEITNTENGNVECVGSDHINTYLIIRAIAEEKGIPLDAITDEEIQQWLKERVNSLKAVAWWEENGENFEKMFNRVKEIDLHFNVRNTNDWYWDEECAMSRRVTKIRKKGQGEFGTPNYKMASIVWRWNHPDNPKNQRDKYGYPNELLMRDLSYLFVTSKPLIEKLEKYKQTIEETKAKVAQRIREAAEERERRRLEREERDRLRREQWERERPAREAAEKIRQLKLKKQWEEREARRLEAERIKSIENERYLAAHHDDFEHMCSYYGMPVFDSSFGNTPKEINFLADIKIQLSKRETLSNRQIQWLKDILLTGATEKQKEYLLSLGYRESFGSMTRRQASNLITKLKREKDDSMD